MITAVQTCPDMHAAITKTPTLTTHNSITTQDRKTFYPPFESTPNALSNEYKHVNMRAILIEL